MSLSISLLIILFAFLRSIFPLSSLDASRSSRYVGPFGSMRLSPNWALIISARIWFVFFSLVIALAFNSSRNFCLSLFSSPGSISVDKPNLSTSFITSLYPAMWVFATFTASFRLFSLLDSREPTIPIITWLSITDSASVPFTTPFKTLSIPSYFFLSVGVISEFSSAFSARTIEDAMSLNNRWADALSIPLIRCSFTKDIFSISLTFLDTILSKSFFSIPASSKIWLPSSAVLKVSTLGERAFPAFLIAFFALLNFSSRA